MSSPTPVLDPATLQFAATVAAHVALAVLVGAAVTARLRAPAAAATADLDAGPRRARMPRLVTTAALVAAAAQLGQLWALAALMGDVALADAGPQLVPVLAGTHAGVVGLLAAGAIGLVLAGALVAARARAPRGRAAGLRAAEAGIVLLLLARASGGHAAASGGAGAVALLLAHVAAGCAWAGLVVVAATAGAGAWREASRGAANAEAAWRYLRRLSGLATALLAVVLASGATLAWRTLAAVPWTEALASGWGRALVVKLAFVAIAIALGGFNRVVGMPAIERARALGAAGSTAAWSRLRQVLAAEAIVLVVVLACAAWLAASAPPA